MGLMYDISNYRPSGVTPMIGGRDSMWSYYSKRVHCETNPAEPCPKAKQGSLPRDGRASKANSREAVVRVGARTAHLQPRRVGIRAQL